MADTKTDAEIGDAVVDTAHAFNEAVAAARGAGLLVEAQYNETPPVHVEGQATPTHTIGRLTASVERR